MLTNVSTIGLPTLTGFAVPAFGYLKYRAYLKTAGHVIDKLGVDRLGKLRVIAPPSRRTSTRRPPR
ncbi:hypothetical protein LV79_003722 [Actinokineospora globicatena]|nr:hypothetical protein [Actinokineospora globicatena]GLW78636.1 hypothetical protein Aglo01_31180 [Actinokineospora globicatena]GLW84696.1 hypothetical protein Aglo02_23360 [Actinokineospora globicatena]